MLTVGVKDLSSTQIREVSYESACMHKARPGQGKWGGGGGAALIPTPHSTSWYAAHKWYKDTKILLPLRSCVCCSHIHHSEIAECKKCEISRLLHSLLWRSYGSTDHCFAVSVQGRGLWPAHRKGKCMAMK